jgi:hypothetical protein
MMAPPGHLAERSAATTARKLEVVIPLAGALVAFGLAPLALPESYSWVHNGISESAAQGIDGAWVTRSGFILFGLAVLRLAQLRRRSWNRAGTVLHGAFGVSMLAVAAFSTRPWEAGSAYVKNEDLLHSVFATIMGISFIAGVIAVGVSRRPPNLTAAMPEVAAVAIASIVPLTQSTSVWGLLQRAMFLTAAVWYTREAFLSARTPVSTTSPPQMGWASRRSTGGGRPSTRS